MTDFSASERSTVNTPNDPVRSSRGESQDTAEREKKTRTVSRYYHRDFIITLCMFDICFVQREASSKSSQSKFYEIAYYVFVCSQIL